MSRRYRLTADNAGDDLPLLFVGNGEDGLHLAHRFDGYTFKPLNRGKSFLTPTVGEW